MKDKSPGVVSALGPGHGPVVTFSPWVVVGLNQSPQEGLAQLQAGVSQKLQDVSGFRANAIALFICSVSLKLHLQPASPGGGGWLASIHHLGARREGVHELCGTKKPASVWEGHGRLATRLRISQSARMDTPRRQGLGFVCVEWCLLTPGMDPGALKVHKK